MDAGMVSVYGVIAGMVLLLATAMGWFRGAEVERRRWEGGLEDFLGKKLGKMFGGLPRTGVRKSPFPGDPAWSVYEDTLCQGFQPPTMMRRDIAVVEVRREEQHILLTIYGDEGTRKMEKGFPVWDARRVLQELRRERSRMLRVREAERAKTA